MNTKQYIRDQIIVISTYGISVLAGFGTFLLLSDWGIFSAMKNLGYSFLASSFTTYLIVLLEAKTE